MIETNVTPRINAADTIVSTERWGPRFFKYDLSDNQVLMFLTLFNRKCGSSYFFARRDDVR